jgi:hypothetical protein
MKDDWPEVTIIHPDLLASPHVYHATYDEHAGTVEFRVFNGGAVYELDPETPSNGKRIATLVPGSNRKTTRRP